MSAEVHARPSKGSVLVRAHCIGICNREKRVLREQHRSEQRVGDIVSGARAGIHERATVHHKRILSERVLPVDVERRAFANDYLRHAPKIDVVDVARLHSRRRILAELERPFARLHYLDDLAVIAETAVVRRHGHDVVRFAVVYQQHMERLASSLRFAGALRTREPQRIRAGIVDVHRLLEPGITEVVIGTQICRVFADKRTRIRPCAIGGRKPHVHAIARPVRIFRPIR